MSKLISVAEASEMLGVTVKTLKIWANQDKIKSYRTAGMHRRFRVSDTENFLDVHDGGASLNTIVNNLHGVDAVFGGHTHTSYDDVNNDADGKSIPTLNAASTGKGYIDLKITVDPTNKIVAFSPKGGNWKALTTTVNSLTDTTCKKIVDDASAALLPIFNEVIGNDAVAYTLICF